jgi:hypothetical protein
MTSDIIHVSLNKLPSSIKSTRFYGILNDKYIKKGRNVNIPIPADVYAKELVLSTVYDMIPAIDALYQFTGEIDEKNYDFIYQNKEVIQHHIERLKELHEDNQFLKEIILLIGYSSPAVLLFEIIENDYDNLLRYCLSKDIIRFDYKNICLTLAKKGKCKCLKIMHSFGAIIDRDVLDIAVKYKNEECVNYIIFYTDVE